MIASVLLAAATAACSATTGSSTLPSTAPATKANSSPTTAADAASKAALDAYTGMWQDMVAVSATSDYQSPTLARHAADEALSTLVKGVFANKQRGVVSKGAPTSHPEVSQLIPPSEPTQAVITDCHDDSHWLTYRQDGHLEDNTPGGRHSVQALASKANGVWKVTQLVVQKVGTC